MNKDATVNDDHLVQSLKSAYNTEHVEVNAEIRKYQSLIDPRAKVVAPLRLCLSLVALGVTQRINSYFCKLSIKSF